MPRIVFLAAMLAVFILQASKVFAGGWTHAPGRGYFKLNEQLVKSESYFQPSGRKTDITELSRYTTSLYGEYGLVDRLTLVGYIPFYQHISEDRPGSEAKTGTGDWELGVRIGLLTNRATVVSIQVMAGLPLGDSFSDQKEVGLFTGDGGIQPVVYAPGRSFPVADTGLSESGNRIQQPRERFLGRDTVRHGSGIHGRRARWCFRLGPRR